MRKLLLSLVVLTGPAFANCGNDNGNGNGCSGNTGPQGPAGLDVRQDEGADSGRARRQAGTAELHGMGRQRICIRGVHACAGKDSMK